jgi:transposase
MSLHLIQAYFNEIDRLKKFSGTTTEGVISEAFKDEPLRRDRRARLDALQTGDGRRLPQHLKAQICRELDRLELLLEQIKAVEAERDALLDAEQTKASAPPRMLHALIQSLPSGSRQYVSNHLTTDSVRRQIAS